jgi:hypothetical protein
MDTWNGRHPVHRQRRAVLADIRSSSSNDTKYQIGIASTPLPIVGQKYTAPITQIPLIRPSWARAALPTGSTPPHPSAKRAITTWSVIERFELRRKPVRLWTIPKGVLYDITAVRSSTIASTTTSPPTPTPKKGSKAVIPVKAAKNTTASDDDDNSDEEVALTVMMAQKKNKKKAKKAARRATQRHHDDDDDDDQAEDDTKSKSISTATSKDNNSDDDDIVSETKSRLTIQNDNDNDDDDDNHRNGGQQSEQCVPFTVVEAQLDTGRTHQVRFWHTLLIPSSSSFATFRIDYHVGTSSFVAYAASIIER